MTLNDPLSSYTEEAKQTEIAAKAFSVIDTNAEFAVVSQIVRIATFTIAKTPYLRHYLTECRWYKMYNRS